MSLLLDKRRRSTGSGKQLDATKRRRWRVGAELSRRLGPWPWIGPAIALIAFVVVFPAALMTWTSFQEISRTGLITGSNGLANYRDLLGHPDLSGVIVRTTVWVVVVVGVTVGISLGLAQLLNQQFPGRRLVRWALIVPWGASVVMSAIVWRWMLNNFYGVVNRILLDLSFIEAPIDWLGEESLAFSWMIWVAIFVSLPFTTFVLIAGLQAIPGDVYEAARIDGSTAWQTYWSITFPLLKPALMVATVINMINVFNNFPIIWTMTQGGPGHRTDITTTFMYKLNFQNLQGGQATAMAVVNFILVIAMVLAYLKISRWGKDT